MLDKLLNIGIHEELDGFRKQRVRNYNGILFVFTLGYLVYIALGIWQQLYLPLAILSVLTLLLFPCFYFGAKGHFTISRYLLAINAWIVTVFFGLYFGYEARHIFLLFTTSILWYIIFNHKRDILVSQILNSIAVIVLLVNKDVSGYSDVSPEVLKGLRMLNIAMSLIVVSIFIILFKINNYKFLQYIQKQKKIIEERQNEMDSSLRYANRIQSVLLPERKFLDEFSQKNFIYFRPKEEVSGDLYWTGRNQTKKFMAVGDCTGHGIPGAMVSILGLSSLDHIFTFYDIQSPGELLTFLDREFREKLRASGLKDGMDITVVMVNEQSGEWSYASANSGLLVSKTDSMDYLKGEKNPIGLHIDEDITYQSHPINLNNVEALYLFSDGFQDQFGGESLPNGKANGKKYGIKKFKELLHSIPLNEINLADTFLDEQFESWKGSYEQIDDVCVVGMKVKH
jgi:serine phosphatase RsbU (regulator of sigma subunit)